MKFEFPRKFFAKYSKPNLMEIRPVGAKMLHAERQKHRHITDGSLLRRLSRNVDNELTIYATWHHRRSKISSIFFNITHVDDYKFYYNSCISFSNYQLNAQFFYFSTIYMLHYAPQHVSSSTLLLFRRTSCITTASVVVTLCKQPYSMRVESGLTVVIQSVLLRISSVLLETCWGA